MNQKISDRELLGACREVLGHAPDLSGRALRNELQRRFGSRAKQQRVYAVWRSLRAESLQLTGRVDRSALVSQLDEALQKIAQLEAALSAAEQRASLAEERERLHQDRWANEIAKLRQQVESHKFRV